MTDDFLDAMGVFIGTFQTFDDNDQRKHKGLARISVGTHHSLKDELRSFNKRGAGVYWMVNHGDGNGRTIQNVTGIRCYFIDLDGTALLDRYPLEPTAIVETSPERYHVYWKVTDAPTESFSHYQTRLADLFNSCHKVIDLPRVLRVPGYYHMKANPYMVRLMSVNNNEYTHLQFVEWFGLEPYVAPRPIPPMPLAVREYIESNYKGIKGNLTRVATTQTGSRNQTLYRHACAVIQDVQKNLIDSNDAYQALIEAGIMAGLTQTEAESTVKSAWRRNNAN